METCFNYCDSDKAFFSSDERRWINRVHKWAEDKPEEVRIIAEPENNDGCIYCQIPVNYLHIYPPTKRELTEEQKNDLRERLAFVRNFHMR